MDKNENLTVGGDAPPLSPNLSLADEERAMRAGTRTMPIMMLLAALVAAGGVGYVVISGDEAQYANFGKNVNSLHVEKFNHFWSCAFQGAEYLQVENDQQLREAIHRRARAGKARFAVHVRDTCLSDLQDMPVELRTLIPPEDYVTDRDNMADAVTMLKSGWDSFITDLSTLEDSYVEEDATESVNRITKGWYDYRLSHGALNRRLEAYLEGQ